MFDSLKRNNRSAALLAILALVFSLFVATWASAQGDEDLPEYEGSVTDLANTLDSGMTRRLENMLDNLKERSGIEFAVVTVKSTKGKKIFDYSKSLANDWDLGALQSKEKSLLLVISTEDGSFITQVSQRARGELPDGLLGEMGSRMREHFSKGKYSEGLFAGVETFITKMAETRGFSVEGMEQAREVPAQTPQPTPTPLERPRKVAESTDALPKETAAKAETEVALKEPEPEATPTKETEAKTPPAKQRSLQEVFTKESALKEPATKTVVVTRDAPEKSELNALVSLPPAERIEKLKAFIEAHPRSALNAFAAELIVSARAALGDEKLQAGDAAGGVEQFQLAITESPEKMSDALFLKVISQLPLNLYLRGQRTAAFEAAHQIEAKVKDNPKRLLALAAFFLSLEQADEAARLGNLAITLAPDLAEAHQILGAAHHIGLRLDDAEKEYARALELDGKLTAARRSLADLRRAAGKAEDALLLYREQLTIDPQDKPARAGVVLSLLDLGKKEEAEREMAAALKDDPQNMALLVGASYWYVAKNDAMRAQELAARAIEIEPRYTWAHIALARSLVAQKRPLEAERILRFARQYGNFPTLDYELASALASTGLYEEAVMELSRSFTIKDGQIETRLAGRVPARDASFIALLAPERRAGIFQATAAETEADARTLKGLLAFNAALSPAGYGSVDAAALTGALADFLAGEDAMRPFRQLYAASRLLARNVELQTVQELAAAAAAGVEAALDTPVATVAVMADDLRDARASSLASGGVLVPATVPRNILASVLRGRIEDVTGWALFNQDKSAEALAHLRRALSVLPESSVWWRATEWHFGAALEATGNQQEALAAYMKAYNRSSPNPVQRAIIEALYRKVNGSLEGLDAKIGAAPPVSSNTSGNIKTSSPQTTTAAPAETQPTPEVTPPASEQQEQKPAEEEKPPSKQP